VDAPCKKGVSYSSAYKASNRRKEVISLNVFIPGEKMAIRLQFLSFMNRRGKGRALMKGL